MGSGLINTARGGPDYDAEVRKSQDDLRRCQEELVVCQLERARLATKLKGSLREAASGCSSADQQLTGLLLPQPMEASLADLKCFSRVTGFGVQVWQFAELQQGDSLQQHVQRHIQQGPCPGPHTEGTLKYISPHLMIASEAKSMDEASKRTAHRWRSIAVYRQHWQAHIKNVLLGEYVPLLLRNVLYGSPGHSTTRPFNVLSWPAVVVDAEGRRHWGMIGQARLASAAAQASWDTPHLLSLECPPAFDAPPLTAGSPSSSCHHGQDSRNISPGLRGENFLELLFDGDQEKIRQMQSDVQCQGVFRSRLEITHHKLRQLMGLSPQDQVFHDVQISLAYDPITCQRVYTVAQIDVTQQVLAERQERAALGLPGHEQKLPEVPPALLLPSAGPSDSHPTYLGASGKEISGTGSTGTGLGSTGSTPCCAGEADAAGSTSSAAGTAADRAAL